MGQRKQQIEPVAAGPQLCYLYMGRRARGGRTTCHCESATAWPATASSVASSSGISARSSQTCRHQRPGYISPLRSPDSAPMRRAAAASRAEPRRQRVSMHGVPACAQRRQRASAQRMRGCARRRQRSRPGLCARMRSGRAAVRASLPIGPSMRGPHGPRQLAVRRPLRTSSLVNPIITPNRMSQAARARARGPPCPLRPGAPSARRPRRWRPARSARRPPRPCPRGTASAGSRRLRAPRRMRLAAPWCAPAKQAGRAARLSRRLWASHAALRVTCIKRKMLEHLTAVRATAPPGVLGMACWGARSPPAPPSGRAFKCGSYWPCPAWLIQNGPGFAERQR